MCVARLPDARLFVAALALSGAACATTGSTGSGAATGPEYVKMEPIVVRSETDPLTGLDGYDAAQLVELGNQLYSKSDFERAVKVYQRLVEHFPDSDLVPAAHYNRGLAFEELKKFDDALAAYQVVLEKFTESASYRDAYFRSAFVYSKLERWREVADTFWQIRQLDKLSTMDELEARVGTGVGLFMQDDWASAEKELMSAVRFYETKSKEEFLPADYFLGQARFYLGEINARMMESIKLNEPDLTKQGWEERMGDQLEEKCDLLLRAQTNFIRTIRVGHTGWATAAGYRIGSLYERLYDDMMAIPVPPGLGDEAKEFYLTEIRKKIGVLVSKAIKIYEQSLEMAARVGEKNEWVERTSKSLERMKSLYLETSG
ncbi:tetratricopeptide repeat protein [Myxococcota bacterium]|nr:tetratricopeptide repeat protein [Myxococcota bacterium]